jgi:hypothetical protein
MMFLHIVYIPFLSAITTLLWQRDTILMCYQRANPLPYIAKGKSSEEGDYCSNYEEFRQMPKILL